jgi:hypothetical protein
MDVLEVSSGVSISYLLCVSHFQFKAVDHDWDMYMWKEIINSHNIFLTLKGCFSSFEVKLAILQIFKRFTESK